MKTKLHLLLIEDSPDDSELITRELKRAGYDIAYERVETEAALRDALAREPWDAVLCDFTLPQFSGKMALPIVKECDADLPFIYVSGTIGEEVAVEAMKSGAHDYVMKHNLKRLAPSLERELREAQVRKKARRLEGEEKRLIAELQTALNEVKRLSGLLPICSGCKQIRAADGTWQPIEQYLFEHSEVQFTHGLCPKCVTYFESQFGGNEPGGPA
jgi:DNA-binding NtrC family response regulator